MNYAIVGTGAIGGFYGGMLAHSGEEVHFLLHNDYAYVLHNGLQVDSEIFGHFHIDNVNAYRRSEDMPKCDVVFVCLKTIQNYLLPQILPPILHPDSIVILIQNGLGVEKDVSDLLPGVAIAGGLAFICSNKIGPGHIHHLEHGDLNFGNYNIKDFSKLEAVSDALRNTGLYSSSTPDLNRLRWRKLVWNMAFNGMTVVLDTTTDQLMAIDDTRKLSKEIMQEVINGAQACGVELSPNLADEMITYTTEMRPYAPSMKLDYDRGQPLEIHYIYENPIQAAADAGYNMTKTAVLLDQLKFIQETRILGQGQYSYQKKKISG